MKLYIAILDEFPDYMVPTLVAHSVLAAHVLFTESCETEHDYMNWFENSFRKVTVRVNQKEFDKIAALAYVHLGHENTTLDARKSCAVVCPYPDKDSTPNVLKYAKLWKPKLIG